MLMSWDVSEKEEDGERTGSALIGLRGLVNRFIRAWVLLYISEYFYIAIATFTKRICAFTKHQYTFSRLQICL